jgi:hypothetical protein
VPSVTTLFDRIADWAINQTLALANPTQIRNVSIRLFAKTGKLILAMGESSGFAVADHIQEFEEAALIADLLNFATEIVGKNEAAEDFSPAATSIASL